YRERTRSGAANCDAVINYKLPAGQLNRASHGERNRVTVARVGERLTQRAEPAVIGVGNRYSSSRALELRLRRAAARQSHTLWPASLRPFISHCHCRVKIKNGMISSGEVLGNHCG